MIEIEIIDKFLKDYNTECLIKHITKSINRQLQSLSFIRKYFEPIILKKNCNYQIKNVVYLEYLQNKFVVNHCKEAISLPLFTLQISKNYIETPFLRNQLQFIDNEFAQKLADVENHRFLELLLYCGQHQHITKNLNFTNEIDFLKMHDNVKFIITNSKFQFARNQFFSSDLDENDCMNILNLNGKLFHDKLQCTIELNDLNELNNLIVFKCYEKIGTVLNKADYVFVKHLIKNHINKFNFL